MKTPPRLISLVEDGVIDEVIAQVRSGKEADVFVVRAGEEMRCAKIYKEANKRNFRQAVQYQEGRKFQNSRSARAISKRTAYGQKEAEASWISAEVEALNKLSAAGVRVPRPFGFFDGVLIMELIMGEDGQPAPQLNDLILPAETAILYHEELITQIVWMLCSGLIHGDLSEFNVLVDSEGPVIIDMPQAVNAAGNNSAGMMFARDVNNMARFFGRFAPEILSLKYAKEIWALYEKGKLTPYVELTGQFKEPMKKADVGGVLSAIGDARKERDARLVRKSGIPESNGNGSGRPMPEGGRRDARPPQSPRGGFSGHPTDRSNPPRHPNGQRQENPRKSYSQGGGPSTNPKGQGNQAARQNPQPQPGPKPKPEQWGRRAAPGGHKGNRPA